MFPVFIVEAKSFNFQQEGVMREFLYVFGFLAGVFGVLALVGSKSAVHEILAGVAFTITAISWSGAAIVSRLTDILNKG